MKIRAVFFDCDGTLLSHQTERVCDSAKAALDALKQNGILRILSTGRHVSELRDLKPMQGLEFDGYITLNGAYTYDADGILDSCPITDHDIRTVYAYLQEHELPIQFLEGNRSYISHVNETVIRSQAMIHTPVPEVQPVERILVNPVYMFIPFGIAEAEPLLAQLEDISATRWAAHDAIDVVRRDAGKERGMAALLAKYGIDPDETAAFGDGLNDASMLEYAGIGVAMGNAHESLKELADHVTEDIDEDGLANALYRLGVLE